MNFSRIYLNKLQVEEGPEAGLCAAAWKKTCPCSRASPKQKTEKSETCPLSRDSSLEFQETENRDRNRKISQFPETEDANKSFALVALELNALATIDTLNFYNSRQKMCSILAE